VSTPFFYQDAVFSSIDTADPRTFGFLRSIVGVQLASHGINTTRARRLPAHWTAGNFLLRTATELPFQGPSTLTLSQSRGLQSPSERLLVASMGISV
jgi:hypothetical protein